jgi:hypothetical protein
MMFFSLEDRFTRELVCKTCGTAVDIRACEYTFNLSQIVWKLRSCPTCKVEREAIVKDTVIGPKIPRWWGDGFLHGVNYWFLRWFGVRLAYEVGPDAKPKRWMFLHMPPFEGYF